MELDLATLASHFHVSKTEAECISLGLRHAGSLIHALWNKTNVILAWYSRGKVNINSVQGSKSVALNLVGVAQQRRRHTVHEATLHGIPTLRGANISATRIVFLGSEARLQSLPHASIHTYTPRPYRSSSLRQVSPKCRRHSAHTEFSQACGRDVSLFTYVLHLSTYIPPPLFAKDATTSNISGLERHTSCKMRTRCHIVSKLNSQERSIRWVCMWSGAP